MIDLRDREHDISNKVDCTAKSTTENTIDNHPSYGGCRMSGCSCTSFRGLDRHNAQFCENCGHARSQH